VCSSDLENKAMYVESLNKRKVIIKQIEENNAIIFGK
jgi:hypothetical protein